MSERKNKVSSEVSLRCAARAGGWSLVAATVLFAAVFAYLAHAFGYPEVLDQPAGEVLPSLLKLGVTGRAVWLVYGLIPLLLLPTGLAVHALSREASPVLARAALLTAVLSALAMMAGLLRWPSLQWQLALAWGEAGPAAREAIAATFAAANAFLGVFIGEFLGELFLNSFFALAAVLLFGRAEARNPWMLAAGLAAAALGSLAMLRNAWPLMQAVSAVNNIVLPVWMMALGVALVQISNRRPVRELASFARLAKEAA